MENKQAGYFGLPFDFKLTRDDGEVYFVSIDNPESLELFHSIDQAKFRIQQFTGILDMHKAKIYFGDKVRFADKVEWYRGKYFAKVYHGIMTKAEALALIDKEPYEERLVEDHQDFEWLLSSEIQTYWEIFV